MSGNSRLSGAEIVVLSSTPINSILSQYQVMVGIGTPLAEQLRIILSICSSTVTLMSTGGVVMLGRAVNRERDWGGGGGGGEGRQIDSQSEERKQ